jgi:hypothetical protein
LGSYLPLDIMRKIPATATATPKNTKMPPIWLMSPAGGVREAYAKNPPKIRSTSPTIFSATNNPMGISVLISHPQDLSLQSQDLF